MYHERSWLQLRIIFTKELKERFIMGKKAKRTFVREQSYIQIPQTISFFKKVACGPDFCMPFPSFLSFLLQ